VLAVASWICLASHLVAQSKTFAGSVRNPGDEEARIRRIEATVVDMPIGENGPPLRLDIQKLMDLYKVPGLSIAVIDNFRIVSAKAYGVIEAGSTTAVTPRTLFQAGSISKPVAATAALYLVQEGKLSLDENVNEKVTLRRLMSHTAGLTVDGFPGYDAEDPLPTLVQILNGQKPANTAPMRVDFVPGTRVRYSGGGVND